MGTNAFKVKNHINIQPGAAPASPVYGDIYCDVSGVFRRWNGTVWEVLGAGGGSGTSVDVAQTGHGFVAADIGKAIRSSGISGEYTFAMADTDDNAEVVGIISDASSGVPNQFSYVAIGPMTGLSGLTTGEVYFLSASASGVATTTEPSVVGQISKPLYIATSPTTAVVVNMRGSTVGGTNLYSTISLANNATTSFHTIQGEIGSGGLLTGSIKIDATTDYAIPFICMFSRSASGTYDTSKMFGADIPAGLNITNSGSSVQIVMPDVTGFSSASVTYAVQAAANGTTLPVNIPSNQISWDVTALSDESATQLGLKQYLHGTNYNGGNAPTVSSAQSGFAVVRAVFIPYKTQSGVWRLRGNVVATFTAAAVTTTSFLVNGITSVTGATQAIIAITGGGPPGNQSYIQGNGNTFVTVQVSTSVDAIIASFDIELASKPTWAY
jgi:hypothetical protein